MEPATDNQLKLLYSLEQRTGAPHLPWAPRPSKWQVSAYIDELQEILVAAANDILSTAEAKQLFPKEIKKRKWANKRRRKA